MSATQLPPLNKNLEMGSGRFGVLYSDPRDPTHCIKRLKTPLRGREAENLNRLVDIARWARPSEVHHLHSRFAWPIEVFGDSREVQAFTMPKAPGSCYFDLTIVSRIADRSRPGTVTETRKNRRDPLQLKYLIDDTWWQGRQVGSQKPDVDLAKRIDIAVDCCDSLLVLHSHGLVYGDISANNIVARLDSISGSYFFDADSISTAEFRNSEPLVSPGWETPAGLDALAIDRSRCALVVLRLITEIPNARPDDTAAFPRSFAVSALLPIISQTYRVGDEASFVELSRTLRTLRSIPQGDQALEEAQRLGFARLVLQEQSHARTTSHRVLIEQAKNQVLFEDQVDQATGLEHRRLIRKSRVRVGQFKLDVRPRFELVRLPTSSAELMTLAYESQFQEIVGHLVDKGLGPLEDHFATARAVDYAHLEIVLPTPKVSTQPGLATIDLSWPEEPFVNCARLVLQVGTNREQFVVERQRSEKSIRRVVSAPRGAEIQVAVAFGSRSRGGREFFPDFGRVIKDSIPPTPVEPKVAAVGRSRAPSGPQGPSFFTVIDPEAQRLEQDRLKQKQRRRRVVVAVGVLVTAVLAFGGVLTYRMTRPESQFVSLSRNQLVDAPPDWGQDSYGSVLVEVERSASSIKFLWADSTQASQLRFQYSYDGQTWTRSEKVEPELTGPGYQLDFPIGDVPPLLLVESLDAQNEVTGRQFLNVLHGTGFDRYPRFAFTPTEIFVTAPPTSLAGEVPPRGILLETVFINGSGRQVVERIRMPGSQAVIPRSPDRQIVSLRVKALFGPNNAGPWFGINP